MNTKKFLELCIVDNLSVKFFFLMFFITTKNKVTFVRIHFHIIIWNSFSTHIWSLLRSTSRFLSVKYGVLLSVFAAKLASFFSKNMDNVFVLQSKIPSMDPWGKLFSFFDHVLKDDFILILC